MNKRKWKASLVSEMRVAGSDSELSDMDNPRGEIIVEVWFVMLEDENGHRLAGNIVSGPHSKMAAALQRSLDKGYDPMTSAAFQRMDPCYGSSAYESEGTEMERAFLERRDEQ